MQLLCGNTVTVHCCNLWPLPCVFISHVARMRSRWMDKCYLILYTTVSFISFVLCLISFSHYHCSSSSDCQNYDAHKCFSNVNDACKHIISSTSGKHCQECITKQRMYNRSEMDFHKDSQVSAVDLDPASLFQPLSFSRWPLTRQSLTHSLVGLFLCCTVLCCSQEGHILELWLCSKLPGAFISAVHNGRQAQRLSITLPRCFPAQNIFYHPSCSL